MEKLTELYTGVFQEIIDYEETLSILQKACKVFFSKLLEGEEDEIDNGKPPKDYDKLAQAIVEFQELYDSLKDELLSELQRASVVVGDIKLDKEKTNNFVDRINLSITSIQMVINKAQGELSDICGGLNKISETINRKHAASAKDWALIQLHKINKLWSKD